MSEGSNLCPPTTKAGGCSLCHPPACGMLQGRRGCNRYIQRQFPSYSSSWTLQRVPVPPLAPASPGDPPSGIWLQLRACCCFLAGRTQPGLCGAGGSGLGAELQPPGPPQHPALLLLAGAFLPPRSAFLFLGTQLRNLCSPRGARRALSTGLSAGEPLGAASRHRPCSASPCLHTHSGARQLPPVGKTSPWPWGCGHRGSPHNWGLQLRPRGLCRCCGSGRSLAFGAWGCRGFAAEKGSQPPPLQPWPHPG